MSKGRPSGLAAGLKELPPEAVVQDIDADFGAPDVADAEQLRRDLAAKEKELDELRAALAQRDAAAQPLPDSGPGRYEVVVRHAPTKLKRFVTDAESEKDAWAKYVQAATKANYNDKDPHRRLLKQFEDYVANGRLHGYDRTIRKVA